MPDIKDTVGIASEVIKIASKDANARAAGHELGKSALTVTRAINTALLPIAALNYGIEKARNYFERHFASDLSAKANTIPPEQVVEPKASIAGPALQGLAFSHDEFDLKELYLNLLAASMDGRISNQVHPAFVPVIQQLTSYEARLLRIYLGKPTIFATVELRLTEKSAGHWDVLYRHLLNLTDSSTGEPVEVPGITEFVDNWIRLGLVYVDYEKFVTGTGKDPYSWVISRPEFIRLKSTSETSTHEVKFQQGVMSRTAFGARFAVAAGIRSP